MFLFHRSVPSRTLGPTRGLVFQPSSRSRVLIARFQQESMGSAVKQEEVIMEVRSAKTQQEPDLHLNDAHPLLFQEVASRLQEFAQRVVVNASSTAHQTASDRFRYSTAEFRSLVMSATGKLSPLDRGRWSKSKVPRLLTPAIHSPWGFQLAIDESGRHPDTKLFFLSHAGRTLQFAADLGQRATLIGPIQQPPARCP